MAEKSRVAQSRGAGRGAFFVLVAALSLHVPAAWGQARDLEVWLDTDGDGLPGPVDGGYRNPPTFDIWTDGKSFAQWTAYTIFLSLREPDDAPFFSSDTADIDVTYFTGGTHFPIDNFSIPYGIGIGGFGVPDLRGVRRLAGVTIGVNGAAIAGCVGPMIDVDGGAPYCTFSTTGAYGLFATSSLACFEGCCIDDEEPGATEARTWGQVKALFR